MTPEQWHRVKEVFEAALERPPEERSAFLGQACGDDALLRTEVKSLLSSHELEKSFLETPAAALAAQSLLKEESAALVGKLLGHYQIIREIGRGGMGVVYLAQDESLGRPVALKLLPKHLTSDPNRLRRFEREARAASALNHHNILTIYEIPRLVGHHSIATEFIDGVTLRERIKSKDLDLSETLKIAEQIASALEAAHEAGIVHRDIKPENLMLRRDGYVKVLDFGLAKLTEQEMVKSVSALAAIAGTNTDTGVMGTVGYMSPEQARGESVDHRTDIFSLGVVIYEMLTGQPPFEAKKAADVIGPIPEQEPLPLAHYLPESPAELQLIVNKALRRNKEERYQTIAEFLVDLKRVSSERPSNSNFTRRLSLWAATLALVVAVSLWFYASRQPAKSSPPPMKVAPLTSFLGFEANPAFSPDGNFIAFCWGGEKNDNIDIYVHRIGSSEPPFRFTSDPAADINPVWSPDGAYIAFSRVRSDTEKAGYIKPAPWGGPERKIYTPTIQSIWGGQKQIDWSPDGKFLVSPDRLLPDGPYQILLISPDTLEWRQLTFAPQNSFGDLHPQFSPDGQNVAFCRSSGTGTGTQEIYIVPIVGGEPKRLTFDGMHIECLAWTADGREIVFASDRGGLLSLWRIAASGGTVEPFSVGEMGASAPSISSQGNRLAFVKKIEDTNIYRLSLDRSRRNEPTRIASSTQRDGNPGISPDGKRIAFESERSGQHEIWLSDSDGSNVSRLTDLGTYSASPSWSPDGQQIAFDSREKGSATANIYVISAQGGSPRLLTPADDHEDFVPNWSKDGQWIYFTSKRSGDWQIWKVPATGGDLVRVTKQGGFAAFEAADGKAVYYGKNYGKSTVSGIWKLPVDGGDEVQVLDKVSGRWGNWAVADDGIYYIDPETKNGAAIEFFSFSTRRITEIASLGKVSVSDVGLTVSPDRNWALYTLTDHEGSDIMMVENFR